MEYISEREIDHITSETGRLLAGEKKIWVTILPVNGEPFWEGGVNGHFFRIKTNVPVEVPKSLADVIARSSRLRAESEKAVRAFCRDGGKRVG